MNAVAVGGDGVERGAEDGAVVVEEEDGTRKPSLAGVDRVEPIERDNSGIVLAELLLEVSGRELSAADIAVSRTCNVFLESDD